MLLYQMQGHVALCEARNVYIDFESVAEAVQGLRKTTNNCFPGCHHDMARFLVADGGDGLQIWKIAANILNKQPRIADKWWWLGGKLIVAHRKNPACSGMLHWVRTDSLKRPTRRKRNTYKILVGKPERKRPFGKT